MAVLRKKILIFSLAYFPKFVGGAEVAVKEITDRLGDKYDFDMITLRLDSSVPREEKIGTVNVYRVGLAGKVCNIGKLPWRSRLAKIFMPIFAVLKACMLHRRNQYHIVWSIMANQAGFAALFFKWLYPNVKFLLTMQEGDPITDIKRKVRFVFPLFKQIFLRTDYIQSISTYLQNFALSMGYTGPASVVPNGVNIAAFNVFSETEKKHFLDSLNISPNEKIVFSASRLVEKNGMEDLILAMNFLPAHYRLVIAGDGYLRSHLEKVITLHKLERRVMLCGFIKPENLPIYFAVADVFVRPSLSEGLGNVFLEAMASRVPVIGTSVGGIPDIIKHQKTGMFVQVHNPREIASCILDLHKHPDMCDSLVHNAKHMVSSQFDWTHIAARIDEIFTKIS